MKIKALNHKRGEDEEPILQYALIMDIANAGGLGLVSLLSFYALPLSCPLLTLLKASELGPWLVKSVPPNFHGITGSSTLGFLQDLKFDPETEL